MTDGGVSVGDAMRCDARRGEVWCGCLRCSES